MCGSGSLKRKGEEMGLKFFHVTSRSPAPMEAELNAFLARHRVVTVERRFVEAGRCGCVEDHYSGLACMPGPQ